MEWRVHLAVGACCVETWLMPAIDLVVNVKTVWPVEAMQLIAENSRKQTKTDESTDRGDPEISQLSKTSEIFQLSQILEWEKKVAPSLPIRILSQVWSGGIERRIE